MKPIFPPARRSIPLLSATLLALALGACSLPEPQSDAVRYFTLAGPATSASATDATRVPPVQVGGHLRNRAVAVRVSEQEIIYLDDAIWAEPLADGITQLLRNHLAAVGGGATVQVQIQRCEPNRAAGNAVEFVAAYTIVSGAKESRGVFTATKRTWEGANPADLVSQLRSATQELAEHLAERLRLNANER